MTDSRHGSRFHGLDLRERLGAASARLLPRWLVTYAVIRVVHEVCGRNETGLDVSIADAARRWQGLARAGAEDTPHA